MIRTKKWIIMSVLLTMLVLTISKTYCLEYTADDNYSIPSQYHDIFNNYFDGSLSYQYFPYKCNTGNYSRECYYGIDSEGNYLNITYVENGNNYEVNYSTGVDEEFSVTGNNIFRKDVIPGNVTNFILSFCFIFLIVHLLLG